MTPPVPRPEMADLGFHQGTITAWDAQTGENTVQVAGSELQDLPMLSIGDTVDLAAGDTVGLLRVKSTMFIVGRIVLPGAGVLATSAIFPETGTVSASGYQVPTSETTVVTTSLTTPEWSNAMTVFATLHATGRNDRGVIDFMFVRVRINGTSGAGQFGTAQSPNPSFTYVSASFSESSAIAGGTEFAISGLVNAQGGAWTANSLNQCDLTYSVIYYRT